MHNRCDDNIRPEVVVEGVEVVLVDDADELEDELELEAEEDEEEEELELDDDAAPGRH